jgi:conserved oligomeric Golgi complex subunit 8
MADPIYELLQPHLANISQTIPSESPGVSNYLSRLVSLRLIDLTTTEPQSLAQAAHSNLVSIQALSSRSHRTTTTSSDHLNTLHSALPQISASVESVKSAIPELDACAVNFATSYTKSRDDFATESRGNALLAARRNATQLARQADKVQDILELPSLLRASIAAASTASSASPTSASGANYNQALDLFAHIKRLQILYPDSQLVRAILAEAEIVMKDMTTNLIASLRGQNLRLAAAIRMIGWLRRVAPELSTTSSNAPSLTGSMFFTPLTSTSQFDTLTATAASQDEGHFGALFLVARLYTFLSMTEALAPLRDLADQETQARAQHSIHHGKLAGDMQTKGPNRPEPSRKASGGHYAPQLVGQQTERYLKRYIEIFREQSFATISMYRNIFPADEQPVPASSSAPSTTLDLTLPSALTTFPLYLVDIFMATLKQYLPNVTDSAARESLLMQVLYAANSLGRLGADFSLLIAELYEDEADSDHMIDGAVKDETEVSTTSESADTEEKMEESLKEQPSGDGAADPATDTCQPKPMPEPEWVTVIKNHRVQAARLEAMAAGQERLAQR